MDELKIILNRYQLDIEFTIDIAKAIRDFSTAAERTEYGLVHDAYEFFDHYQFSALA